MSVSKARRQTGSRQERLVASSKDIQEGDGVIAHIDDLDVGIFRIGGALYAYQNRCAHQGGPVCTGEILGRYEQVLDENRCVVREQFSAEEIHIVCPWHGWEYDIRTGRCVADPRFSLHSFRVTEREGSVYVEI